MAHTRVTLWWQLLSLPLQCLLHKDKLYECVCVYTYITGHAKNAKISVHAFESAATYTYLIYLHHSTGHSILAATGKRKLDDVTNDSQ